MSKRIGLRTMGSIVGKAGVAVTFDSTDEVLHLGSISLNGVDVGTLPATKTLALGTYTIKFSGVSGLTFNSWNFDGDVSVYPDSAEAQLTVNGTGTVTALYVLINGVEDGDFEEPGIPDWDVEGGDEHGPMSGQYTEDAYHGSNSLYLAQNAGQTVNQGYGIYLSVSDIVYFTLWSKCPSPLFLEVEILYDDYTSTIINFGPLTEDWAEYDVKPYLEAGKTVAGMKFYCNGAGYILVDYVDLFYLGAP